MGVLFNKTHLRQKKYNSGAICIGWVSSYFRPHRTLFSCPHRYFTYLSRRNEIQRLFRQPYQLCALQVAFICARTREAAITSRSQKIGWRIMELAELGNLQSSQVIYIPLCIEMKCVASLSCTFVGLSGIW